MPEGSTCGTIDGISFVGSLGEFKPKLMRALVVSSASALNLGDNAVPLLEDPTHTPVKCWFIGNLLGKCKLIHLKWMGLFQVRQLLTRSTIILPFAPQLPPSGGVLNNFLTIDADTWLFRDAATDGSLW